MAYLMVKRIWNEEIIELMGVRLRKSEALRLAGIAQRDSRNLDVRGKWAKGVQDRDRQGEIWIEVEAENKDVIVDPACFTFPDAQAVLVEKLGATPEIVAKLLTDERTQRLYDELKADAAAYFLNWKTPRELEV